MFYHAAREGLIDPARSVQVGLRTTNDDSQGFAILDARQVHRQGTEAIIAAIRLAESPDVDLAGRRTAPVSKPPEIRAEGSWGVPSIFSVANDPTLPPLALS
jgi:hypothetical protein